MTSGDTDQPVAGCRGLTATFEDWRTRKLKKLISDASALAAAGMLVAGAGYRKLTAFFEGWRTNKRKKLILGASALAAVGTLAAGVGALVNPSASRTVAEPVTAVGKRAERAAVAALGRIEPASEVIEVGASIPDRIERLVVAEGERVKAGQILGYLDVHSERLAERELIAAKLREARSLLQAEIAHHETQVRDAEIRLQETRDTHPLKISAQEAKIRSFEVELANNIDLLKQGQELLRSEARSRQNVNNQKTLVRRNEEDLKSARDQLAELKFQMTFSIQKAENDIARARASLARAMASIGVEALEKQFKWTDTIVHRATLRSPIDGQILKILIWPGERTSDKPVLRMGDTERMHAVAEVYETDIGFVKLGQRAKVTSPALEKPLSGKVVRIGNLIFKKDILNVDPAAAADARVVEVRIELDESEPVQRLSNLTVDVVIQIDGTDIAKAERKAR